MESNNDLGKLISAHGISPVFVQRAVFIAMLSFVFFIAMMVVFYVRQNLLYFILATAFLLIYIITMLSWVVQKRYVLRVFEKGVTYKKISIRWSEVAGVNEDGEVLTTAGGKLIVPRSLNDYGIIMSVIKARAGLRAGISANDRFPRPA